jgi:hypothetical protein
LIERVTGSGNETHASRVGLGDEEERGLESGRVKRKKGPVPGREGNFKKCPWCELPAGAAGFVVDEVNTYEMTR